MVELEPAMRLIEIAHRLRVERRLLTGQAAGEVEETVEATADLLDDVFEVRAGELSCRNTSLEYLIGTSLALLRPGIYGHLDNDLARRAPAGRRA
jgi:hypothetical protein